MPRPGGKQFNAEQKAAIEARAWVLRCQGLPEARITAEICKTIEDGGLGFSVSVYTVHYAIKRAAARFAEACQKEALAIKAVQMAQLEHVQAEAMDAWERSKSPCETEKTVQKAVALQLDVVDEKQEPQGHGGSLTRRKRGPAKSEGVEGQDWKWERRPDKSWVRVPITPPDREVAGMYVDADGEETDEATRAALLTEAEGQDTGPMTIAQRTTTKVTIEQVGDPRFLEAARAAMADIRKLWGLDAPVKTDLTSGGEKLPVLTYEVVLSQAAGAGAATEEGAGE